VIEGVVSCSRSCCDEISDWINKLKGKNWQNYSEKIGLGKFIELLIDLLSDKYVNN
jgi:hypothetical protein